MFYCLVSSLFTILHVDLWMPDYHKYPNGHMALMNEMCDMSQFVVVVPVRDDSSATLAEYFMQDALMKLDLCHLVVLYDGSPFKGSFVTIWKSLHISSNILAKRNHEGLTVEYYYRF